MAILCALYLAQGLPYGFFTQALPVLLREMGVSLEGIGLASLLALPWALKFLWAPVLDRYASPRVWILTLQVLSIGLTLAIAGIHPLTDSGLTLLLTSVLLTNFVAATQDIATDGLAVKLLAPAERGWGNGIQVAGYRVGMILGGGLLLAMFEWIGWRQTFILMATFLAIASLPLAGAPRIGNRPDRSAPQLDLWSWLRLRGALPWVAILVAFKFGDYLAQGMLRPWMVDNEITKVQVAAILGTGGFTSGLVGAVVGGALVNPIGRTRALVLFGFLQTTGILAYAACIGLQQTGGALWGAMLWEHFVGGLATAALFTAMMDACRNEVSSTDYTVQASIVVLASMFASSLSGFVATQLGYLGLFLFGALLSLAGPLLALIPWISAITRPPPEPFIAPATPMDR